MRQLLVPVLGMLSICGATGCSKAKEDARDQAQAAVATAIANTALADKGQHIDATNVLAAMQEAKNMQNQPAKRAILNFRALTPFLPEAPAGWTATPVEGSTTAMGAFQVSEVSRRYTKGQSNLKLTISDMSQNPGVAMMALAFSVTEDSTTGYRKPYGVGGVTGTEHWTIANKHGEIQAMTKNQVFLSLDGNNLEGPEVSKDLMAKVDVAKLGSLNP